MTAEYLKSQWSVIRAKLKEKYPVLTENDLAYVLGHEEEILDCAQRRTGLKREEIEHALLADLGPGTGGSVAA